MTLRALALCAVVAFVGCGRVAPADHVVRDGDLVWSCSADYRAFFAGSLGLEGESGGPVLTRDECTQIIALIAKENPEVLVCGTTFLFVQQPHWIGPSVEQFARARPQRMCLWYSKYAAPHYYGYRYAWQAE